MSLDGIEAVSWLPLTTVVVGGMFGFFFTDGIEVRAARQGSRDGGFTGSPRVSTYQQATTCNIGRFKRFFHAMLAEGVYLAPSAYEAGFISSAHSDADIAATLAAAARVFAGIG